MIKNLIVIIFIALLTTCLYGKDKKVVDNNENTYKLDYNYAFSEATKQYLLGNFKQALILYSQCIKFNPNIAASYYQISQIYSSVGNLQIALEFANKAYELDDNNIWYQYHLASLYNEADYIDSAIMVYKEIVEYPYSTLSDKYTLASLYLKVGKYKKSKTILLELVKDYGLTEEFGIALHKLYRDSKEEKKAIETINQLIGYDSLNVKYYGILAEYYQDIGKMDLARSNYEKMLSIDSENYLALFSSAEFYKSQKEYEKSFSLYSDIIILSNASYDIKLNSVVELLSDRNLYLIGADKIGRLINRLKEEDSSNIKILAVETDYCIKREAYDSALVNLKKIISIDSKNYMFWEQMMYIQNLSGLTDSLIVTASKALNIFPGQASIYLFKSIAEIQLENYNEAVKTINEGLKYVDKEDMELRIQFYTFLGDAYHNLNLSAKSDSAFSEVLKIDPENALVLNNYSYYLSLRDTNLDHALKLSKRALEKDPLNSSYLDTYAWILYKQKNFTAALEYIHKAYSNGGEENPEILEHYGDILLKLDRKEDAKRMWEKAYEQNKDVNLSEKINSY